MTKQKIKRQALQILKNQTKTPVIGLKQYTENPTIDIDQVKIYQEFTVNDTLYAVWKQEQQQPKVAKKESINYVR